MKKQFLIAIIVTSFIFLAQNLSAKEKAERKDKGFNKAYLSVDQITKELQFQETVKQKVDKILQGALEAIKAADQSQAEQSNIEAAILSKYDTTAEYVYEADKNFKGDEDDPDFELSSLPTGQLKKLIDELDKTRDQAWGWFWAQQNRDKRDIKEGNWTTYKIIKKLAWNHYRQALDFHAKSDFANAKKQLLVALWFWPAFVEAHVQLGIENIYLNALSEAEINFKRAIKIDQKCGKAYYGLSLVYLTETPLRLFNSVESVQYARELGYQGAQDYYEFVTFLANVPAE